MKIVIPIDDAIYEEYLKQGATLPKYGTAINSLYKALWNGVPLPEHHGRLIDADALAEKAPEIQEYLYLLAPTIIKADREE